MTVIIKILPDCVREQQRALTALRARWESASKDGPPGWSADVIDVRAASIDRVRAFANDVDELLSAFERAYGSGAASSVAMSDVARLTRVLRYTYYKERK